MEHAKHTHEELTKKLREIYPEIAEHGLNLRAEYDHDKEAWLIHLNKGVHELTTHLEKKDADACLEGVQCVYLGVQIGQFIKNFETPEG